MRLCAGIGIGRTFAGTDQVLQTGEQETKIRHSEFKVEKSSCVDWSQATRGALGAAVGPPPGPTVAVV